MGKIEKCDVCEIRFPDIGNLESEVRVRRHMKTHTCALKALQKFTPRISLLEGISNLNL